MAASVSRVAVVGLGNAGHTLHLPALAGISSASVVGAVDVDAGRRARAAAAWKAPVFEDFDAMLAQARPEVVVIGTPPQTHAEYCLRALEAGANVICEKPFVSSLEEADRVIDAAATAGRRVALNHEFREMPIFRAVRDHAKGVVFAQAWQLMDLPPWAEANWRSQMLTRTLYEAGVHLVDYIMALFGEKPHAVSATMSTCGVRDEESDAVALVTLEFSRGRLAQIVQNRLCKGETQYFEVRADTPAASYRASFGGRARLSAGMLRSTRPHVRLEYGVSGLAWKEVGHERTVIEKNPKDPAMLATRILFEKTLSAFRDGGVPPASAEDGRDVLEVIAACYHAAATGRRVALADIELRELAGLAMGELPVA
ncbi:MAG: Gfo/Idh/MocA family oxidoreductase [Gemmatimonadota bacterium]|nr:Gfo/Idh/MocA family oxidoreductase [Gemmatimonadota bacterium]